MSSLQSDESIPSQSSKVDRKRQCSWFRRKYLILLDAERGVEDGKVYRFCSPTDFG